MSSLLLGHDFQNLLLYLLDCSIVLHCDSNELWSRSQALWVVLDFEFGFPCPLGYGQAEHIEWVKGYADIAALSALDTGFQLAIEEINKNALLSLFETFPELKGNFLIRAIVRILILDVRFL